MLNGRTVQSWIQAVLVVAAAVSLSYPPALAQQLPSAGITREQVEITPERVAPGREAPEEAPVIEEAERPAAEEDTEAVRFLLNGLTLTGITAFEPDEIEDTYAGFIGTEVTLGGLREIADRIEQRYRGDGFVATRVIIPPQAIKGGVPTLSVFEGKIIHYEINGEIGPVKKQIARLLDNLLTDEPARWSELERYLLLARDLPGISLTGTLRSAGDSAPGGVILVVDTARKELDGFLSLQNRNANATGPFTISGGAAQNSTTEFAERLGFVALIAPDVSLKEESAIDVDPEQITGFMSYEQSLGDEGLVVRATGTVSAALPGDELASLDLTSISTIFNLELEYPLIRSRDFSLWTRGGIEFSDQHITTSGNDLTDDQIRLYYFGMRGLWLAPFGGRTEFDVELRQSFERFGATPDPQGSSNPSANPGFGLVRGSLSHTQPILPFFELYGEFQGQHADSPLFTLEQMSLGELTIGRGFEPGVLSGDSGFGIKSELRYRPPGIEAWWLQDFQVYGFYDAARVYERGNPTQDPDGFEELSSTGAGVRFTLFETFFGDVYVARPLNRGLSLSSDRPDATVKLVLTKFF